MRLNDARRLMGPNFLSRDPLVIVELEYDAGDSLGSVVETYRTELNRMRSAFGLDGLDSLVTYRHATGVICAYTEPIDVLLAHTEMAEWAGLSAAELLAGRPALPLEPKRSEIALMLEVQHRPRVLALREEARRRGLPFLWEDEEISIGAGARMRRWSWADAPAIEDVPWTELGTVPIALITGTNGKTTCSRLLARVAKEAGFVVGSTSTNGVTIGGQIVGEGDQTGPAAARQVLRDPSVQFAVLETARGGIMRRGLAVDYADAALVTNVGADHLGHFGIDDVKAMAKVKSVVGTVAKHVVLNARDPELVALADSFSGKVIYFSSDPDSAALKDHDGWVAHDGWIVHVNEGTKERVLPIADIPITFDGTAIHNVENALAVAAMSSALGLPREALKTALRTFTASDNPGRGQLIEVRGVKVLLDFGHNGDGVRAIMKFVESLRNGGRLLVSTAAAGDRSDDEVKDVVSAIAAARPDHVIVRELEVYLRGKQLGEVPARMRHHFTSLGVMDAAIDTATDEVSALRSALDWARPGDVIVILVHTDEDGTRELLASSR